MVIRSLLLALVAFICLILLDGKYPMTSLQCFSSLTKPKSKLICPEARNSYCVKEVSTLTQDICGATQYFGDMYVNKQCQYKKCADTCEEGTYSFQFEGKTYARSRYCCNSDSCNAGSRIQSMGLLVVLLIVSVLSVYLYL